ncbi:MAG: hypothetical protein V2I51_23415 [Anderseniella sp.]|nr:hypothetical protein [Anderseniella sp.]
MLLLFAAYYSARARNPEVPRLAAFLIFTTVLTTVSFSLFMIMTYLSQQAGYSDVLSEPALAALFLLIVFVPGFLLARWQIRKPPKTRRMPPS